MSLGVVEVCYQRSSSALMFQDLEDEARSSELVSIQLIFSYGFQSPSGSTLIYEDLEAVPQASFGTHVLRISAQRAYITRPHPLLELYVVVLERLLCACTF